MGFIENLGPTMAGMGNVLVITLMSLLFCGVMLGIAYLYMKNKLYKNYTVFIYKRKKDKEGKETLVFSGTDKAAIIKDKKLKKRVFKLKKNNVHLGEEEGINFDENRNLDIPSIPSERGGEVVFLEKLGPKKFAIATPFLFEGNVQVVVTEADVAEAIRAYDINAKYFGGNEWSKWVGPIAFAVFAVLIIVLISVVLQKFDVLKEVGDKLVEAAQIINAGRTSAVPSGVT